MLTYRISSSSEGGLGRDAEGSSREAYKGCRRVAEQPPCKCSEIKTDVNGGEPGNDL